VWRPGPSRHSLKAEFVQQLGDQLADLHERDVLALTSQIPRKTFQTMPMKYVRNSRRQRDLRCKTWSTRQT
jgi:hypothetical protein